MVLIPESHIDHGLSGTVIDWLKERFKDRTGFFIETVDVQEKVPCGLYGPIMGDPPVPEIEASYQNRGSRQWPSRLVKRPMRMVSQVTVIAGPHAGLPCVLYTAFGGPPTLQEPGDPACKDVEKSKAFWADHALVG